VSGPVTTDDEAPAEGGCGETHLDLEVTDPREAEVGRFRVRRALPRRARRTVGAWCFVDLMGPADVAEDEGLGVPPHPHIGLQTATWLIAGEALHRDSLGTEQLLRPGQLNLMTAGGGIAHSEEGTTYRGPLQGIQLWIAQPEATRHGAPHFEHHAGLPQVGLGAGDLTDEHGARR
jgi:quercetin 2,3-dioxygenase